MIFRFILLSLISGFCYTSAFSQAQYKWGGLPLINLTVPLSDPWKLNARAESRHTLATGRFDDSFNSNYNFELTDISLFAVRKIKLTNSFAFGVLIRNRKGPNVFRIMQQYTITKQRDFGRIAHRIVSDQSFERNTDPRFRLRYRFSIEWPLSGQSVDRGESYIKLNNEYLNEMQGGTYELELRLVPAVGFKFQEGNKLELGLDYRLNSFLRDETRHILWHTLSWYIVL